MCEWHVSLLIILSQFPFYQWWHYSLKQICSVEKETAFRSPGPSSCNLCRGYNIVCRVTQQDQVCRSTLSNSSGVCVCVFVCILGSIIRTGCLAPYVRSVQGSWENKVLRGPLCYCYLPPPRVVFEDRKYESDRSPRGMWQWFILQWPLTYPLHPRMLSHTTPSALKHSPLSLGPKIKRPDPAQPGSAQPNPAQHNGPCVLRFVWATNEKQMDSVERTEKRRRRKRKKERESCKIFAKKNNPGTLSNYIYLSCVVLLGRPCGLPGCSMAHFSHYLILDGELKKKRGWVLVSMGGFWWGGGWPQGTK